MLRDTSQPQSNTKCHLRTEKPCAALSSCSTPPTQPIVKFDKLSVHVQHCLFQLAVPFETHTDTTFTPSLPTAAKSTAVSPREPSITNAHPTSQVTSPIATAALGACLGRRNTSRLLLRCGTGLHRRAHRECPCRAEPHNFRLLLHVRLYWRQCKHTTCCRNCLEAQGLCACAEVAKAEQHTCRTGCLHRAHRPRSPPRNRSVW